jgi:hypothetical protein
MNATALHTHRLIAVEIVIANILIISYLEMEICGIQNIHFGKLNQYIYLMFIYTYTRQSEYYVFHRVFLPKHS